jgi:hypothetical protein
MAGDWIKMRMDLQTHPKVVRMMSALKADKFRVIGGLHAVWSVFDAHSEDGRLSGYTPDAMDAVVGWPGLTHAMVAVGWATVEGDDTLCAPRFDEHNGKSAKRRAQETVRKRESRKSEDDTNGVSDLSAMDADKKRSREEKRREDIKQPPIPPKGGETDASRKRAAIAFKTFLEQCRSLGEKPIPESDTVFDYADKAGIPMDFLRLHWLEFKDRYGAPDSKRYKDWRTVYRKSVRGNWFKLWYLRGDGACGLTTQGEQALRIHQETA